MAPDGFCATLRVAPCGLPRTSANGPEPDEVTWRIRQLDALAQNTILAFFQRPCGDCGKALIVGEQCPCLGCSVCGQRIARAESHSCDWCNRIVCTKPAQQPGEPGCLAFNLNDLRRNEYVCRFCRDAQREACGACHTEFPDARALRRCWDCGARCCVGCREYTGTERIGFGEQARARLVCVSCVTSWSQCTSCTVIGASRGGDWLKLSSAAACIVCERRVCHECLPDGARAGRVLVSCVNAPASLRPKSCATGHIWHLAVPPGDMDVGEDQDQDGDAGPPPPAASSRRVPCRGLVSVPSCAACAAFAGTACCGGMRVVAAAMDAEAVPACEFCGTGLCSLLEAREAEETASGRPITIMF